MQPRRPPPFLSITSVVFTSIVLVAVKQWKEPNVDDEMRMQTWWWTELEAYWKCSECMATIGRRSHVSSQALGEVRHLLVGVFLWQLFPDEPPGDFQLIMQSSCI